MWESVLAPLYYPGPWGRACPVCIGLVKTKYKQIMSGNRIQLEDTVPPFSLVHLQSPDLVLSSDWSKFQSCTIQSENNSPNLEKQSDN